MGNAEEEELAGILLCPSCKKETEHTLIHCTKKTDNSPSGNATVKCMVCNSVYKADLPEVKKKKVRIIVSEGALSRQEFIELNEDEMIVADSEMDLLGHRLKITALEVGEKRPKQARVFFIDTIWAKVFDTVPVKITVNFGRMTRSFQIILKPDEEVLLGQEITLPVGIIRVHGIRTHDRMIYRGGASAKDIVRVFGKPIIAEKPKFRRYDSKSRDSNRNYTRNYTKNNNWKRNTVKKKERNANRGNMGYRALRER